MYLVPVGEAGLARPLGDHRAGWKEECLSFIVAGHRVDHLPEYRRARSGNYIHNMPLGLGA